jgi:TRAP-type C4-dicarboxylate transport system substrate-binding protein
MKRLMKTAAPLCAALVLAAGAFAPSAAKAETQVAQGQNFTLRFSHVLGPREPFHEGFLAWARAVEARTNGGLKMEVFHSSSLGRVACCRFR